MSLPVDIAAVRAEMEEKRRVREEERVRLAAEEDARMEAELKELEKQEVARLEETRKEEGKGRRKRLVSYRRRPNEWRGRRGRRRRWYIDLVPSFRGRVVPRRSQLRVSTVTFTFYVGLVNLFSRGNYPKAGQRRKRRR